MADVAELSPEEAEQMSDVAVEPEAVGEEPAVEEGAEGELEQPMTAQAGQETADPELLAKQQEERTASEQAYGKGEMGPNDRKALLEAAQMRIAAMVGPFTLACSNRREELRARGNNSKLIGSLGKIAFGEAMPGIQKGNPAAGVGMPEAAMKEVGHMSLKSGHMKKSVAKINKIPLLNFNLNYPKFSESETSEEFIDILMASTASASEAMTAGLDDYSNEDLAALVAAFDPKQSTCSIYEDHIDAMIAKMDVDVADEEAEELDDKVAEKQADAAGDDPEEQRKMAELDTEKGKEGGDVAEKHAQEHIAKREAKIAENKGQDKHSVLEQVPDEMKDMYDNRAYTQA